MFAASSAVGAIAGARASVAEIESRARKWIGDPAQKMKAFYCFAGGGFGPRCERGMHMDEMRGVKIYWKNVLSIRDTARSGNEFKKVR